MARRRGAAAAVRLAAAVNRRVVRRLAAALGSLVILGAGPAARTLAVPGRDGTPAHQLRVLLWTPDGPGRHPVLVYQPSWGGRADENSRLAAVLAQAGFVVAAVDYATAQPPGFASDMARMAAPLDLSSAQALARTTAEGDWRAVLLASDASVMLDLLPQAQAASGAAIFGWSFGGAVAVEACRQDRRFEACLNMDGWMFGPAAEQPSPQPYMILSGDPYPDRPLPARDPAAIMDERDAARLRARLAAVGGTYVQLPGVEHAGFSDAGDNAAVQGLVTAFFVHALLGGPPPTPPPGVTWHHFPRPAS